MSLALQMLADRYAFESSPTRHDLGALHVPFDDLTQPGQTEARLDAAVRRREPVALIGASGSGKSSAIAHMLGPLAESVAPLFVPLAAICQPRPSAHPPTWSITCCPQSPDTPAQPRRASKQTWRPGRR